MRSQLDRIEGAVRIMAANIRALHAMQTALHCIIVTQGESTMATLAEVQASLDTLATDISTEADQVHAELEKLRQQIIDGTAASPEQLDGVLSRVQSMSNAVKAFIPDEPAIDVSVSPDRPRR